MPDFHRKLMVGGTTFVSMTYRTIKIETPPTLDLEKDKTYSVIPTSMELT